MYLLSNYLSEALWENVLGGGGVPGRKADIQPAHSGMAVLVFYGCSPF